MHEILRTRAAMAALWLWLASLAGSMPVSAMESGMLPPDVRIDRNIAIPARDGVHLNGVLYRPVGATAPLATILAMTPYMADGWHTKGMYFARHGFAFLVVDQRGRGNSEGHFVPWEADGRDGYDTVGWIARQPWSDGKVGMMGGSYVGRNQWATAKEFPPALKTIVPTSSNFIGVDMPTHHGIMNAWTINWYAGVYGRTMDNNYSGDYDHLSRVLRANYLAGGAFATIGDLLGMPSPVYDTWFSHPSVDSYWKALSPSTEDFRRMNLPILTITGQYDGVQLGALEYYKRDMAAGGPGSANHYLVIGPWNHAGTRKPKPEIGGLAVGDASLIDIDQLHLAWFDWTLRHGSKPALLVDKVVYYVTGSELWQSAPSLNAAFGAYERFYLAGPGDAHSVEHAGRLETKPPSAHTAAFTYDPKDRSYGRSEPVYSDQYLRDTYAVDHLDGKGLIYETAPFKAPRTLAGQARLSLTLTVDVPDTDLEATLYEVDAAGHSLKLSGDSIRLRYRDSDEHPTPMPIGKTVCVRLPDFTFVAREIVAGSRLRLLIRPIDSIYAQKNYNSGGDVSRETIADARVAHIQVTEGDSNGSYLELPFTR